MQNTIKTVLEMDLISYGDIAMVLEENLDAEAVKSFEDQIQLFVDRGLEFVGLRREDVVIGSSGDNAILTFVDPGVMHRFAHFVQQETVNYNKTKSIELARRWFRMGAATGIVLGIPEEKRIVGLTVTRAVRLEAAGNKGQLLIDLPTFEALPENLKRYYGPEEIFDGKRGEHIKGRRVKFVDVPDTENQWYWLRSRRAIPIALVLAAVVILPIWIFRPAAEHNQKEAAASTVAPQPPQFPRIQRRVAGSPGTLRTLTGHSGVVSSIAFSPGSTLASAAGDTNIKIWDTMTGRLLRTLPTGTLWNDYLAFSPNGEVLAVIGAAYNGPGSVIKLLDAAEGREIGKWPDHPEQLKSLAFSPDQTTLVSGGDRIKFWDVATGRLIRTLPTGAVSVVFSPDGRMLGSSGSGGGVELWDVASASLIRTLNGHTQNVRSIAFSPDGLVLASGSDDKTVKTWDVASGKLIRSSGVHTDLILAVAFSPDGRILATTSLDKTLKLWDLGTGEWFRTITGDAANENSVAFSPDGQMLAWASDNTIKLWDVSNLAETSH
jgi:WD40 repeat protein